MGQAKEYDYIIVGAGSAGCLLAYRLGANPENRILVIEAGGPDTDPLIHIPLGLGKMHDKRAHDWGYDAEPEESMQGRRIEAMRGKVVGGSSSINVMAYVRGHRGDYDRWPPTAQRVGRMLTYCPTSEGWSRGKKVQTYGGVGTAPSKLSLLALWTLSGRHG